MNNIEVKSTESIADAMRRTTKEVQAEITRQHDERPYAFVTYESFARETGWTITRNMFRTAKRLANVR